MKNKKSKLISNVKYNICEQYNEQFEKSTNNDKKNAELPKLELPPIFEITEEKEQENQLYKELEKMGINEKVLDFIYAHCILNGIPNIERKVEIETNELNDFYNEDGIYKVIIEKNDNKEKEFDLDFNKIYRLFDNYFASLATEKKLTADDIKDAYDFLYTASADSMIKWSSECYEFIGHLLKEPSIICSQMANEYNKKEIERLKKLKNSLLNDEKENKGPKF